MKYLKYLILLLLLFPIKVDALINFSCKGPAKPGEDLSCEIKSDSNITHFEATLVHSDKVTYFGAIKGTGFTSLSSQKNLEFTSEIGGKNVATIQLHVSSNITSTTTFTVGLNNIKYTFVGASEQSSQNNLQEIVAIVVQTTTKTTTTKKADPVDPGTSKTFTVTLDSNNGTNKKDTLSCNTTGSNCNIDLTKITEPIRLGYEFAGWGNTANCTSGSKSSYRADSNATLYACWTVSTTTAPVTPGETLHLKSLEIEGQEISFSKFKFNYDIKVLYEIESLVIKAEPVSEDIMVTIGDASALQVGDNHVSIVLTDNEGNTSEYVINIKRLNEGEEIRELSSDATLKSVSLGKYTVAFSPTIIDYTLEVDSKTTSIPVTAEVNDENATYEVEGNTNISSGSVIKINVTAEDGTINTYNFYISVKKNYFEENQLYLIIAGGLFLLLIILLLINRANKKKIKPPKGGSKAPQKKAPTTAPKSVPKTFSRPPVTNNEPKIEVLDI